MYEKMKKKHAHSTDEKKTAPKKRIEDRMKSVTN